MICNVSGEMIYIDRLFTISGSFILVLRQPPVCPLLTKITRPILLKIGFMKFFFHILKIYCLQVRKPNYQISLD